jgi:hypothetical protein
MKKILLFAVLAIFAVTFTQAQRTFPFQKKTAYTLDYDTVINLTLNNTETVVTIPITGATTINVSRSSRLYPGDRLSIIAKFDSIRVITMGTSFGGYPGTFTSAGANNYVINFIYDGTTFYPAWGIGVNGVSYFTKTGNNLTTTTGDTIGEKSANLYLSGTTSVNGTLTSTAKISAGNGVDLGTNKALTGTTAITIGNNGQTIAVNSSDWDISATGVVTGFGLMTIDSNIVMQNGEIISNAVNGTIDIGAAAMSASLYNWVPASGITGTADTVLINTIPDITVATGTRISFINEIANTGATVVAIDGGAYVALEEYAVGTKNALDANDMIIGQPCEIMYNGSEWILISSH